MSAALINTKVAEAIAAQEAGDYTTAHTKLLSAKALLAAMPTQRRGQSALEWDRTSIDSLIREIKQLKTSAAIASSGIRKTKVHYVRPCGSSECD